VFDGIGQPQENSLSRMIVHLLSPKESHCQGDKYLKAFIAMIDDKNQNNKNIRTKILDGDLQNAEVKIEHSTDEKRRIDITVSIDNTLLFGIENKKWAEEQSNQLKAYFDFITTKNKNGFLIFLCIETNREPKTIIDWEKHCANGDLIIMDYHDISNWLDKCLEVTQIDKIRFYLNEFKTLISKYFYSEGEDFMIDKEQVCEVATKTKDDFEAAMDVLATGDFIKEKLLKEKLVPQLKALELVKTYNL
jgi:predicted SnoaL-like aldol condensation-catalyzing enzyme